MLKNFKKIIPIFFITFFTLVVVANIDKISKIFNSNDNSLNFNISAGTNYITNFSLAGVNDKQIWAIEQDTNGIMFFANKRGIIIYDGFNWDYIKTPSTPYKIFREPKTNTIFVGCSNGIGFLENKNGMYAFKNIEFGDQKIGQITDILANSESVFFYNENYIARVNIINHEDKNIVDSQKTILNGIFKIGDKILVNKSESGFFEVHNDNISTIPFFDKALNADIIFSIQLDNSTVLLGTSEQIIYKFDGINIEIFQTQAQSFFTENYIVGGVLLNNEQLVISTINAGAILINKNNGNIENIINYSTGLPDNEIYSSFVDKNNGLWFSHISGLSRVDYSLPIKNYTNYYGLKGNIISTSILDTTLYVATTNGVFYLTRPKNSNELNELKKEQEKNKKENTQANQQTNVTENQIDENNIDKNQNTEQTDNNGEEEKKGLFQKWKEKRKNKNKDKIIDDTMDDINTDNNNNASVDSAKNTVVVDKNVVDNNVNKNNNVLVDENTNQTVSLNYNFYYKKIEGIDSKVKQIIKLNDLLIVATNNGLFQIKNYKAEIIIENSYITSICTSSEQSIFYVNSTSGIYIIKYENQRWKTLNKLETKEIKQNIFSIAEDNNKNIWLGMEDMAYLIELNNYQTKTITPYYFNTDFSDKVMVKNLSEKIYFFISGGIYYFNQSSKKLELETEFTEKQISYIKYIAPEDHIIWYNKNKPWQFQENNFVQNNNQTIYLNLFENINDIKIDDNKNIWIVNNFNSIYQVIQRDSLAKSNTKFELYIKNITADSVVLNNNDDISLAHNNNSLNINVYAPYFLKENSTKYQYMVKGLMNEWSEWTTNQTIPLYLKSGKYVLHIKAKNILEEISDEKIVKINIRYPFWQTTWFYAISIILSLVLVIFIFRLRQRNLIKSNHILELKVIKRTKEIELQKEELRAQKDEIEIQRDLVTEHRDKIVYQNKQITDSIEYASRIQSAVLPLDEVLEKYFAQHFIVNMPRDVVSGDFYFFKEIDNKIIVAVADCTGHGVPGAFLSMMGLAYLNEIAANTTNFYANEILNSLRKNVIDALRQSEKSDRKDGMDISLCLFDAEKKEVQFAGAYNPLFLIRKNEIVEIHADKMPIGFHRKINNNFTSKVLPYFENDIFYMFSDGYMDQFGGASGRKFLKANFKELLLQVSDLPMKEQKELITSTFNKWKGDNQQIDDVLILGIKV